MNKTEDPCIECQLLEERDLFLAQTRSPAIAKDRERLSKQANKPTLQKQTENRPFLKQEEFEAVFESSSDCIVVLDKDLNYTYANQANLDYLNTTCDKVIGKNLSEVFASQPEFMNLWKSRVELVFETGKALRLTDAMPFRDKFVYSESVLSPIWHPDGRLFAVSVLYRDVTKQKLAEIELKASKERFQRLSETTFGAIAIHKNGKLIDGNQKLIDLFGYTLEEHRQFKGLDAFAPQSRKLIKKNMALKDTGPYEALGLKKDGTIFPIEIHAREIQLDGEPVRIGAIKDLTRRKEMERQLSESEKKYRELYNRAQVPLYRTRISDGKMLECNRAMAELLGYQSSDECLRQHYSKPHYANPAQREELLRRLQNQKEVTGFEIEFIRLNGSRGWVSLTAAIYPEDGYIEGVQIDITATKVLTPIEKQVLAYIMRGEGNKQIARIMERSVRTIEEHRAHIMQKLGAGNLVELAKIAQFMARELEDYKKTQ